MAYDSNTMYNAGNILQGMSRISEPEIAEVLHMSEDVQRFRVLMMKYECAISEVRTKLVRVDQVAFKNTDEHSRQIEAARSSRQL